MGSGASWEVRRVDAKTTSARTGGYAGGLLEMSGGPTSSSRRATQELEVVTPRGYSSPRFRRARRGFVPQPRGLLNLRARRARVRSSRSLFALDEGLDAGTALVVGELHRRRLHQVGRRRDDRA